MKIFGVQQSQGLIGLQEYKTSIWGRILMCWILKMFAKLHESILSTWQTSPESYYCQLWNFELGQENKSNTYLDLRASIWKQWLPPQTTLSNFSTDPFRVLPQFLTSIPGDPRLWGPIYTQTKSKSHNFTLRKRKEKMGASNPISNVLNNQTSHFHYSPEECTHNDLLQPIL